MKKRLNGFTLFFSVPFIFVILFNNFNYKKNNRIESKMNKLNLSDVNNIMIVAHPDDELLWGGSQLISEKYLVVCVTCGVDKKRETEFIDVMNKLDAPYINLSYPDLTNGKKDNWSNSYDLIKKDIDEIIKYKKMDRVVTHNPDGEYGHIHHKLVSKIVTEVASKENLYYFNKYYSDQELKKLENNKCLNIIDESSFKRKLKLLELYYSQSDIINNHISNIAYEKIISYDDWNNYYLKGVIH